MGRTRRFFSPDVTAGDAVAVARFWHCGAGRRAVGQHDLVLHSVDPLVHRLAVADPVRTGILGGDGDRSRHYAGALRLDVLDGAAAGAEALTKAAVVLLSGGLDSMVCA